MQQRTKRLSSLSRSKHPIQLDGRGWSSIHSPCLSRDAPAATQHAHTHTSTRTHIYTHITRTYTHTHTQHARTHTQCHTPGRRSICICVMLVTSVTQPSFSPLRRLSPTHHSSLPSSLHPTTPSSLTSSLHLPLHSFASRPSLHSAHIFFSPSSHSSSAGCLILSLPLHLSLASPSSSPSSSCFSSSASALSASSATQMQCCDSRHEVWQSSPCSSVLSRPYPPSPSPICARPPTRSSALAETASRARPLSRCVDDLITSVSTRQSITAHLLLPQRRLW